MKIFRIKQNIWGNWYGYHGTKKAADFGTDERTANEWLAAKAQDPNATTTGDYNHVSTLEPLAMTKFDWQDNA